MFIWFCPKILTIFHGKSTFFGRSEKKDPPKALQQAGFVPGCLGFPMSKGRGHEVLLEALPTVQQLLG